MFSNHSSRLGLRLSATAMALILLLLSFALPTAAIVRRDVDYSEDFSATIYRLGTQIVNNRLPLHEFWTIQQFANYAVAPCSVIEKNDGVKELHFQGYSGMLSTSEMFDDYTYSVTMRLPNGVTGGIAVAARHAAGSSRGPLYEADRFREDGGNPNYDREGFRHDYSGIAVYPTTATDHAGNTKVVIGVKTFEDNGKSCVANRYYEAYVSADLTKHFTISFVDKNQVLTVKLNNQLLCTVEMSNPGTFNDPADKTEYYRTAVIKDSTGDAVLELDNARLAVNARLAITNRSSQCYISEIKAFSHNPENGTLPPDSTEDPTTESTAPVDTTEDAAPSDTADDKTADSPALSTDLILLIVFGVVQVALVVAIALLVFGKKKE